VVEAAGVGQFQCRGSAQVTDSIKSPKRQNRTFRRFEVHGGYTKQQFKPRIFAHNDANETCTHDCLMVPLVVSPMRLEVAYRAADWHGSTPQSGVGNLTLRTNGL